MTMLTAEQYLELERAAEFRHEYFNGEMFEWHGSSLAEAMISVALTIALWTSLRGKCIVAGCDLRIQVSKDGPFFYPNASICCGEPQLADDHEDNLLNPSVIFEIVSPFTEAFNRGKKFAAYRRIESLREYVLVSQTEPSLEAYVKGPEGTWILKEFSGPDAVCHLQSVGCDIVLANIYRNIPALLER
jgi:Uma2 family endonuclease